MVHLKIWGLSAENYWSVVRREGMQWLEKGEEDKEMEKGQSER